MEQFLGPFCKEINLKTDDLLSENINPIEAGTLKNGVIFELKFFQERQRLSAKKVIEWILLIDQSFCDVKFQTIKTQLNRLYENKNKIEHKKKVKGIATIEQLRNEFFVPTFPAGIGGSVKYLANLGDECPEECSRENTDETISQVFAAVIQPPPLPPKLSVSVLVQTDDCQNPELRKQLNSLEYEISKKEKHLSKLQKQLHQCKDKLEELKSRRGHFSVRNVNKRDDTARKTRRLLRQANRAISRQSKLLRETTVDSKLKDIELYNITHQNEELKKLVQQEHVTQEALQTAENLKLKAQKSDSYFKKRSNILKQHIQTNNADQIVQLKQSLKDKDNEIHSLQIRVDELNENLQEKISTKNYDGSYSDSVRLAVIELTGLEVAVEKVSPVIQSVAKMCGQEVGLADLPNSTTVQSIVDEGHFLAKTYIAQTLENTDNWGLSRDGTTRRKQKILDTSVTLDTGDVISLGFSRVAHETAATINNVTKQHMTELADAHANMENSSTGSEEYIRHTLSKLAFTMSDRASNEKLADKLLNEWRDSVLADCDEQQKKVVHHFHCMAHVLLGFHKYICDDLKELEKKMVEANGPLGRDTLPIFKSWSKKGTALERSVRTTSDIFGPVGDHHGLHDRWEAYCLNKGIKSTIGNYRDNRFNAIFQTSAEIILHHQDFLEVLATVKQPNLKLKSVEADLRCDTVITMMKVFGLIYLKITGPYWNLMTSGCVAYLELFSYVQDLRAFLEACVDEPSLLLKGDSKWLNEELLNDVPHLERFNERLATEEKASEFESQLIIVAMKAMVRTIEKQLVDFLPGGQYSMTPKKDDIHRTGFAHVTNLGCEHHFGDLDSSQKRRPNASMHHHSSVQLLKRNRNSMRQWLDDMPKNQRSDLLKSARKGGRALREIHRNNEKLVLSEIHEEMVKMKDSKKKRSRKNEKENQSNEGLSDIEDEFENEAAALQEKLPEINKFLLFEYVAVAYQDAWYLGCVDSIINDETAVVRFMAPCRAPGHFKWPQRQDNQTVQRQFILKRGFIPECVNSGRQWLFKEFKEIDAIYRKYREVFF